MKRILLTGASAGIGRATAITLVNAGHRVVGVGRDAARLDAVRAAAGEAFTPLALDLVEDDAPALAVERAITRMGSIDTLIVAHGIAEHAWIDGLDGALLDRHYRANLRAPLLLTRAFVERAARPATVIFVTSTLAHRPAPSTTAYAASKAGLLAAAKALAVELHPMGIRVATLSPGLIDTEMLHPVRLAPGESMPEGKALEDRREEQRLHLEALPPLGRLGRPEEVARGVLFLLESELAVGTDLVLDGGLTVRP
jgi:NAD(P)-dependent dehydrogenase (short-subunit alcohol dehydrogenase family)